MSTGRKNPVAKFMEDLNRPATMVDRKKESKRGRQKHRKPLKDNE